MEDENKTETKTMTNEEISQQLLGLTDYGSSHLLNFIFGYTRGSEEFNKAFTKGLQYIREVYGNSSFKKLY